MNFDNKTMVIMQGASGSGKSTYAKKLESIDPTRVIVSRDSIREQLMGKELLNEYFEYGFRNGLDWGIEEQVTVIEHEEIARALGSGKKVIIDNTNLRKKYVLEYIKIAIDFGLSEDQVAIVHIPVTLVDACQRVAARGDRNVNRLVIAKQIASSDGIQWDERECFSDVKKQGYTPKKWFVPPFEVEKYAKLPDLPTAVLCDIDGTLAFRKLKTEPYPHLRGFFDYEAVEDDEYSPFVLEIIRGLSEKHKIIFVSGRKEEGREATEKFLKRLGIKKYILLMRDPTVDYHDSKDDSDDIVKYRIFNEEIRDNFNVLGVIDDRKRVVALWEALGLSVLNAGKLNEVF